MAILRRVHSLPRPLGSGPRPGVRVSAAYRVCIGNDNYCPNDPVPDGPVALCPKHLREVYAFAQDMVSQRWDAAVREYVGTLHDKFKPPPSVLRRPRQGYVYFIRLGDRVKIGFSEVPASQLKNLPHEEVIGIVPGTREDEQTWHRLLADFRVTGEWFRAEPEVLAALAAVVTAQAS